MFGASAERGVGGFKVGILPFVPTIPPWRGWEPQERGGPSCQRSPEHKAPSVLHPGHPPSPKTNPKTTPLSPPLRLHHPRIPRGTPP